MMNFFAFTIALGTLFSSAAFASDQWEKTVCTAKTENSKVTFTFRIFHSVSDILNRGQLSTTVLAKAEGSYPTTEWVFPSSSFTYTLAQGFYLVETPSQAFQILYGKDGEITGSYVINGDQRLKLDCKNISSQSVPFLFEAFFKGLNDA